MSKKYLYCLWLTVFAKVNLINTLGNAKSERPNWLSRAKDEQRLIHAISKGTSRFQKLEEFIWWVCLLQAYTHKQFQIWLWKSSRFWRKTCGHTPPRPYPKIQFCHYTQGFTWGKGKPNEHRTITSRNMFDGQCITPWCRPNYPANYLQWGHIIHNNNKSMTTAKRISRTHISLYVLSSEQTPLLWT